jgi:hypothetical protein
VNAYGALTAPDGSELVPTASVPVNVTAMLSGIDAVTAVLSVTRTVKLDVATVVGVPVIAPVDEFSDSPAGNDPEMTDHE